MQNTKLPDKIVRIDEVEATELIEANQKMVWRYLRALGCDDSLSDDLTQETFLAVLRRPFHKINEAATSAYLRRVAYQLLVSYKRKYSRVIVTDELNSLDNEWSRWAGFDAGNSAIDLLSDCFGRLTRRAQMSLRLRFRKNASRASIAKELDITEHGVKNLMQRAKSQLKECVESRLNQST